MQELDDKRTYEKSNQSLRLATAYIPNQPYEGIVPLELGLKRGSIFTNLYQPYK